MSSMGLANPNKDYDILKKIVLIGDSGKIKINLNQLKIKFFSIHEKKGVGKTSLLQRFAEQHFSGKFLMK